jgi:hypothetical protein
MAKDQMVISLFKGIERRMHAKDTIGIVHMQTGRAEIIGEGALYKRDSESIGEMDHVISTSTGLNVLPEQVSHHHL